MWDFAGSDPTFRTTLASFIQEAQDVDLTLWYPLALLTTYFFALVVLKESSSWRDYKVTTLPNFIPNSLNLLSDRTAYLGGA